MVTRHIMIVLAGLFISSLVHADVYRWQDNNGVTHYADTPPEGVEAVLVPVESHATDPQRVESQRKASLGRQQSQLLINREADAKASEKQAAQAEDDASRKQACTHAQEQLFSYEHSRRLYKDLGNGERQYYTDEEVAQARETARKAVETFCK